MINETSAKQKRIGVAFSGGGIRAVAYHCGVLKWFAEKGVLENIEQISSVSGGSLFVGLVFHFSGYQWPSSGQYIHEVLPKIKKLLNEKSLQKDSLCRWLSKPGNWRYSLSRANVVSKSIEEYWGVRGTLGQLTRRPLWSINGTALEDGRRFRFKGTEIGNYEMGYADASNFSIASAMAVSIAFPGGIGPLSMKTESFEWYKKKQWGKTAPRIRVYPEFQTIHLYDGGMYDNLGMEPFFDVGKQAIKTNETDINFIVLSDAGAPFIRASIPNPLHPQRLIRIANIASDQVRSLRIRSFVNFLKNNPENGMYIQIGSKPLEKIKQFRPESVDQAMKDQDWLDHESVEKSALHKTHLNSILNDDFEMISRHGYETALWNGLVFGSNKQ